MRTLLCLGIALLVGGCIPIGIRGTSITANEIPQNEATDARGTFAAAPQCGQAVRPASHCG